MSIANLLHLRLPNALPLAALALLLALNTPSLADSVHIRGTPGITDADTLRIGTDRIRLHGIDAPERDQQCLSADGMAYQCGQVATKALADFIAGRSVDCRVKDVDRYGRAVAVCRVDGTDLNGWLVSQGWALAYRKYSEAYIDEEERAREGKVGMWAGEFVMPWDWRRAN